MCVLIKGWMRCVECKGPRECIQINTSFLSVTNVDQTVPKNNTFTVSGSLFFWILLTHLSSFFLPVSELHQGAHVYVGNGVPWTWAISNVEGPKALRNGSTHCQYYSRSSLVVARSNLLPLTLLLPLPPLNCFTQRQPRTF